MRRHALVVLTAILILPVGTSMVMNANTDQLPPGCNTVNGWENITINAGREYAEQFNGKTFTYDNRSYDFKPCQKVTVTFVNNDTVRHQWMVHRLPKSVYKMGMFSIEVTGPGQDTGTFILPNQTETLKVHCGVPQHEQKGMKAQIKINGGDGSLPNIPGITGAYDDYNYPQESPLIPGALLGLTGILLGALLVAGHQRWKSTDTDA